MLLHTTLVINKVHNELERQSVDNYYDLLLNEETSRYVYRILAVKEILNNPNLYGLILKKMIFILIQIHILLK